MVKRRGTCVGVILGVCALLLAGRAEASGVPISGFYPFMGVSLTNEFKDENDDSFYVADLESSLVGTQFGSGGTPFYDVALLDTGAALSLITYAADASFNIQGAGFRGTNTLDVGGATGVVETTINDPMGMFLTGVANRTETAPLTFNTATMVGQSSISLVTLPAESELPNVVGIPFLSTYATFIRNDQPQIFTLNGKTIRSPHIQLLPRGTGNLQGIARNELLTLDDDTGFSSLTPPLYIFDFNNILNGLPLTQNPMAPTVMQAPGAMFLDVIAENTDGNGQSHTLGTKQFFLDTGADVTVVSSNNAVALGIDPILTPPDFSVSVIGSGGITEGVPGYFIDKLTIPTAGGVITAEDVPVLVLNVPNPAHSGLVVDGILGTNILSGRNVVIDPNPAIEPGGDPAIYISDPVTSAHSWSTAAASGTWSTSGNWNAADTPDVLWIANARNVLGGAQEAVVSSNSTVWELNVSGTGPTTMTVRVSAGVTLTTFSGANVEAGGKLRLDGGTLDAQFVDVRGGTLMGSGTVATGSGPIAGQVENHGGTVAPGNGAGTLNISGRFANAADGTLAFELGGFTAGSQHDQLNVDGGVALDGTLAISLIDAGGGLFSPSAGNTFTILTATDDIGGVFDTYQLPNGYVWNILYGEVSITLNVIGVGISGDFNLNGIVDAADYVVWRSGKGTTYQQADYKIWQANYGKTAGSGSVTGAGLPNAVPEPTSCLMLVAGAILWSVATFLRPTN